MRKHIILWMGLCCLWACNPHQKKEGTVDSHEVEVISVKPEMKSLPLSSFTKGIKVIPLETTEGSLLSGIQKIEIDDSCLFIQDMRDKFVYVFTLDGTFKHRIGTRGEGPGEMLHPACFALNRKEKEVWLVDNHSSFYKFAYDGEFREKTDFALFYKDFAIGEEGDLYFHASKLINYSLSDGTPLCWNLWIKSTHGEGNKCYFPYSPEIHPNGSLYFETKTPFNRLGKDITYHYVFSDTIYSIQKGNVSTKYRIDFGSSQPHVQLNDMPGELPLTHLTSEANQASYVPDVMETDSILRFQYVCNKQVLNAFYFKQNKRLITGKLENDLLGGDITFLATHGNKLIGIIEPATLSFEKEKVGGEIARKLEEVNEDSNPVLIICEIKSHEE